MWACQWVTGHTEAVDTDDSLSVKHAKQITGAKKKRENGIRKEIGAVKLAIQHFEQTLEQLLIKQKQILSRWQEQRAAQGQMTYNELTTWLNRLQALQKHYSDIGTQCVALEKELADCRETLCVLQNTLRLTINSQEKLKYMIHEQSH